MEDSELTEKQGEVMLEMLCELGLCFDSFKRKSRSAGVGNDTDGNTPRYLFPATKRRRTSTSFVNDTGDNTPRYLFPGAIRVERFVR